VVTVAGAEAFEVTGCTFERLDNAAIFLGGYHRGTLISDNHFAWLGESAIVAVGDTRGSNDNVAGFAPGFGWDASGGDQPRGTRILRNFARELGIINKQSAFYFQAAVSNTTLDANTVFNGARSGINFNDALGTGQISFLFCRVPPVMVLRLTTSSMAPGHWSGSKVSRNTLFNLNRETADHGCFNR
jgi:hypothetical protein